MCNPVAAVMVVGAVIGGMQEAKQAKRNVEAAEDSAQARQDEIDAKAQLDVSARVAQARRERARMIVAQGESGLSMSSVSFEESLMAQFGNMNKDVATIHTNARSASRSTESRLNEIVAGIPTSSEIFMGAVTKGATSAAGTT